MPVTVFRIAAVATVLLLSNQVSFALEELIWRSKPSPAAQAELLLKQYKSFMIAKIDSIDRACKLTKAQKSRLTIASKGAVDRAMGKWKTQQAKELSGRLRGARQLGRIVQIEAETRMTTAISSTSHPVLHEPIWTKSISKLLSDEQKAKLKEFEKAEAKRVAAQRYRQNTDSFLLIPQVPVGR